MKKMLLVVLILALGFLLTGCSSDYVVKDHTKVWTYKSDCEDGDWTMTDDRYWGWIDYGTEVVLGSGNVSEDKCVKIFVQGTDEYQTGYFWIESYYLSSE